MKTIVTVRGARPPTSAQAVNAALLMAIHTRGDGVQPHGDGDAAGRIVERLRGDLTA